MTSTENPPTAPGDEVIPGARTAPARREDAAENAQDVAALVEKEIG